MAHFTTHVFVKKAAAVKQAKHVNATLRQPGERPYGVVRSWHNEYRVRKFTSKTNPNNIVWSPRA